MHITLLETSYSTCFRKRPFFSGISSTCTLSLLNSSCRVWESSSGFPWGVCIRNCSGSLGSFTGGFAKSRRQKGKKTVDLIRYSERSRLKIFCSFAWCSQSGATEPEAQPGHSPRGYAASHTFPTPVPPCSQHPGAPPIISSQRDISTKQRITGQICSVNQLRGLHFLSVQLPP